MADYEKMYLTLFSASERAIGMIEAGRPTEHVRTMLISAERRAEEIYINSEADESGEAQSEEEKRGRIKASFERFSAEERRARDWVKAHAGLVEKIVMGKDLAAAEMRLLISAVAEYGVYPLYFIHERRTETEERLALLTAANMRRSRGKAGGENEKT